MADQPTWVALLGDNSAKIEYPAAASLTDLMDTVEALIAAYGWALHDANAGTNARAYKALNLDGSTYKYIVLDYNTSGYLLIKVYETWNATTHVGGNLCHYADNTSFSQRVGLSNGGRLYVFASARYLIIESHMSPYANADIGSAVGNSFCGCIEVTRDNPEDTPAAGYPCWGFLNGNFPYRNEGLGPAIMYRIPFAFPRTRDGSTGVNARGFINTGIVPLAEYEGGSFIYFPSSVQAWNSKNYACTLSVGKHSVELKGRLYGIKVITRAQGSYMDDINIKVDANGFFDPNGTLTPHWVLTESGTSGRYAIPK